MADSKDSTSLKAGGNQADTPSPELVEIFEYHFGIDLREAEYYEARYELAEYFGKQISRSVADFYKHTTGIGLQPSDSETNKRPSKAQS